MQAMYLPWVLVLFNMIIAGGYVSCEHCVSLLYFSAVLYLKLLFLEWYLAARKVTVDMTKSVAGYMTNVTYELS